MEKRFSNSDLRCVRSQKRRRRDIRRSMMRGKVAIIWVRSGGALKTVLLKWICEETSANRWCYSLWIFSFFLVFSFFTPYWSMSCAWYSSTPSIPWALPCDESKSSSDWITTIFIIYPKPIGLLAGLVSLNPKCFNIEKIHHEDLVICNCTSIL